MATVETVNSIKNEARKVADSSSKYDDFKAKFPLKDLEFASIQLFPERKSPYFSVIKRAIKEQKKRKFSLSELLKYSFDRKTLLQLLVLITIILSVFAAKYLLQIYLASR